MDKSEENRLCLKFNFTSSRVSQKFLGCLLVPYLGTPCSRSQKRPILCFSYSHFWSPWTLPRHPVNEFSMYPDLLKNWSWGQGCIILATRKSCTQTVPIGIKQWLDNYRIFLLAVWNLLEWRLDASNCWMCNASNWLTWTYLLSSRHPDVQSFYLFQNR